MSLLQSVSDVPSIGAPYPWIVRSTAMVNHFYFYCADSDIGLFLIKFCSYFPYNAKLCINGHEYLKHPLLHAGVAFAALDNGLLSCADPALAQRSCDEPERTRLHRIVQENLATFLREAADRYPSGELPEFITAEFERYLRCGILRHGFARVRCLSCRDELLVAFSCKNRDVSLSCSAQA